MRRAAARELPKTAALPVAESDLLTRIFTTLRAQTGHDFSSYKLTTTRRRIDRRMVVNQIDRLDEYVQLLTRSRQEVDALFREMLIGVTSFFRDPEAWQALCEQALIPLLTRKPPNEPLRVWVPASSSGEEPYSIAILIQEVLQSLKRSNPTQIFATDIDGEAIEQARVGVYPNGIAADLTAERLARFFTQEDSTYRIHESIRDKVVFAVQDVVEDPPFSHLDLIACRNLLMYMDVQLQRKVLATFHFALAGDGYLFLGTSETVNDPAEMFQVLDRKWKVYQRLPGVWPHERFFGPPLTEPAGADTREADRESPLGVRVLAERSLLQNFTPASAIANEKGDVLYIHGRTGRFLEPAPGEASLNLLRMAREGLRRELSAAFRRAVGSQVRVQHPGLRVRSNGEVRTVNLTVMPITNPPAARGLYMAIFEDVTPESQPVQAAPLAAEVEDRDERVAALERELRAKDEDLKTTVEELETSNEELKSMNEELQATNEELQSANEELMTSREELQSVNEELTTVNSELRIKVDELSRAYSDLDNLMSSTDLAVLFVDLELQVQRYTAAVSRVLNLIPNDVGRPITHVVSKLRYDNLVPDIQSVMNTLVQKEVEVQGMGDSWYMVRMIPYRSLKNVIEGVVVTFTDVTARREANRRHEEQKAQERFAREYAEHIIDTLREPFVVLDAEMRVLSANQAFYEHFRLSRSEVMGQSFYELSGRAWDAPELRRLLSEVLPKFAVVRDLEVENNFGPLGKRKLVFNAREIRQAPGLDRMVLLAMEDKTGE